MTVWPLGVSGNLNRRKPGRTRALATCRDPPKATDKIFNKAKKVTLADTQLKIGKQPQEIG
jgi:hypothetical protein